jgi:hypothetical protein
MGLSQEGSGEQGFFAVKYQLVIGKFILTCAAENPTACSRISPIILRSNVWNFGSNEEDKFKPGEN